MVVTEMVNEDSAYTLDKNIESDLTLEEGKTYTLNGGIHVKAGATLTIPKGVTIIAKNDDVVDDILVEQGAKINAERNSRCSYRYDFRKRRKQEHGAVFISADMLTPTMEQAAQKSEMQVMGGQS